MEFTRKATDPDQIVEPIEDSVGYAVLIASAPDYVVLPKEITERFNIPLRANVLEATYLPCPVHSNLCVHYKLDVILNGKRLWVAKSYEFYWYLKDDNAT